ncbi:hypothetical protein [Salibacterium qingdaonense]|uniref:DUF2513 domain-containing protein n=1 Tax=Salibacterium qingdaonense TaxID=266892 RepID=A0A1I4QVS4_9BACI|nr:hypothetical protein [Salibacterium qingdaonense]SFM44158.1 hypothetical protein SAMN04488054_15110 [Salibacterium qingdaonense]
MNRELTRELLLLVDAVADGLLSFDLTEVTQIYLPDEDSATIDVHIDRIAESGLLQMKHDRVVGLSSAGREFLS